MLKPQLAKLNAQQATTIDAHQSIRQLLEIDEVNLDMATSDGCYYLYMYTLSKANVVVVGGHKTQLT